MAQSLDSKHLAYEDFAKYFTVERPLGIGTFGAVALVKPTQLAFSTIGADLPSKLVAKKISLEPMSSRYLQIIRNEIAVMKTLNLRHSVKYYGGFENSQYVVLLMSLAPGQEMFGLLTDEDAASRLAPYYYLIALDLARALVEVHSAGLAHRDIKPENIYVYVDTDKPPTDNTAVKVTLLDFAFACHIRNKSSLTCVSKMGTPGYLMPDLVSGVSFGTLKVADWWAFGVIMEFMFNRQWQGRILDYFPEIKLRHRTSNIINYLSSLTVDSLPVDSSRIIGAFEEAALYGVSLETM